MEKEATNIRFIVALIAYALFFKTRDDTRSFVISTRIPREKKEINKIDPYDIYGLQSMMFLIPE